MKDDDQKALNPDAGDETSVTDSPTGEPKTTKEVKPTEASVSEDSAELGKKSSKKGAQTRIRELNAKAKAEAEKAKSLEQRLSELTKTGTDQPSYKQPAYDPNEPIIKPGETIDGDQLNRRLSERESKILQQAQTLAELRVRQGEAVSRINTEAKQALQKYPELDPDSEKFNKELSESVTEATIAYVKSNPYSASPKKFVDKMMRPYKQAVAKEVGKTRENLAKQVSQAAQRPTSVSTGGKKSYKDMTIEELEEELGIVYT